MKKEEVLGNLPKTLRDELIGEFNKLVKNYREERWEPSEMSGGKLCEIVYSILAGHVGGVYPKKSSKPSNMVDACKALEKAPASFPRTVRIQIPRVLIALYEVRSNRGAGHVGGDVDPSHMDATFVLYTAKWLIAELVRHFHSVDTVAATQTVELLTEREISLVWTINGQRRVLDMNMSKSDQTLVLLSGIPQATDKELCAWVEHSNFSVYKKKILLVGHKERQWEYDTKTGVVTLSQLGVVAAEKLVAG
ncbi:MAG TPA: hypothetical protein VFM68_01790 [Candidatus Saccharimonadales bacterium]|nr:hypothetical protein [Candidatus Saccharimonadales bacterium]